MAKQITIEYIESVKNSTQSSWKVSDIRKRENGVTYFLFTCCQNEEKKVWVPWRKFQQGQSHGCKSCRKFRNPGKRNDPLYLCYSKILRKAQKNSIPFGWSTYEEFKSWATSRHIPGAKLVKLDPKKGYMPDNLEWQKIDLRHLKELRRQLKAKWIVSDTKKVGPDGKTRYLFTCTCGKSQWVRYSTFKQGMSKSCFSCSQTEHGFSGTRIHYTYYHLKSRAKASGIDFGWGNIVEFAEWARASGFSAQSPLYSLKVMRKNPESGYNSENCFVYVRGSYPELHKLWKLLKARSLDSKRRGNAKFIHWPSVHAFVEWAIPRYRSHTQLFMVDPNGHYTPDNLEFRVRGLSKLHSINKKREESGLLSIGAGNSGL